MDSGAGTIKIKEYYREAFRAYNGTRQIPEIHVVFYPYVGINHTIRIRDRKVFVRIADICRDMPGNVQKALAHILVAKLFRKRVPPEAKAVYSEYIKTDHVRERAAANKRARGRKIVTGSKGSVYDLEKIYNHLNERFFEGKLKKPVLTWSARRTYRILGHHDATHNTVVISRSLDTEDTPRFVVEYVVFHELLHIKHPTVHHRGRRYNHTPAFRRDEETFPHFDEAERWIEKNVRKLKSLSRKKPR